VPESVGTAWLTLTLSLTSTEPVTVDYGTVEEVGSAKACSDAGDCDYQSIFFEQVTFAPEETVAAIGVDIEDDDLYEQPVEWLQVTLQNVSGDAIGAPTTATLQIEDDDPPPVVGYSAATYIVGENEGTAPITVVLHGSTALTATVDVRTDGGTATPGVDYGTVERTLVFTPGVTSRVFAVDVFDDGEEEDNETVELVLGHTEEAQAGSVDRAVLTIVGERQTIYLPLVVRG
jgi:hypothetical protein